ncbi:CBS domain-containing protein [Streptomyces botrytidirepellens]|uniref:CBS domain-containing protein n=1 Tax=Streptomyces botrytidirepellens TaxID=2486417 RepID=A0A3M8W117_9ACTN|nr:CBS domain-containing protein [Streptomyces botrytidirepellens]RNG22185.1 CBS domain-containing protein [Streptomyces botrytidirepellens]
MLRRRTVGDVMTEEVVTFRPSTPFQEVAAMLDANDIAAAPVVDDNDTLLGMVSASDVLRHETGMPDPQGQDGDDERAWGKARARTAGALMSSPVFTARADWTIPRAARELRRRHVKQLPVVGDDRLLGIVSRSDLLDAFIRSDVEIRDEVEQDVLGRILGLNQGTVAVEVRDGDVTLRGHVPEPRLIPVVVGLCQGVDGVVTVDAHLTAPG